MPGPEEIAEAETLPTPESHQEFFKAIKCDDLDGVKKALKSSDLDPKTVKEDGLTPLQYALVHATKLFSSSKEGASKVFFKFLVNVCTTPEQFNVVTKNNETLLLLVYENFARRSSNHKENLHEFVETLLDKGASPSVPVISKNGTSILHLVCMYGEDRSLDLFLGRSSQADTKKMLESKIGYGYSLITPLQLAVIHGTPAMVERLVAIESVSQNGEMLKDALNSVKDRVERFTRNYYRPIYLANCLTITLDEYEKQIKTSTKFENAPTITSIRATLKALVTAYNLKNSPKPNAKAEDFHTEMVTRLKARIKTVVTNYQKHSRDKCKPSPFHHHGGSGRRHAREFLAECNNETQLSSLLDTISNYLNNDKGNFTKSS